MPVPTTAAMPDDEAQAPAPYDLANEADDENAYRNIATLKLPFNTEDPKYWFKNFERKLKINIVFARLEFRVGSKKSHL